MNDDEQIEYEDAIRLIFEHGKPSAQLLQRRLRIGYGRASMLIERMRTEGLISSELVPK